MPLTSNQQTQVLSILKESLRNLPTEQVVQGLLALTIPNPTDAVLQEWVETTQQKLQGRDIVPSLKHHLTDLLVDRHKATFGRYYTPPAGVEIVKLLIDPLLKPKDALVDLSVGFGAFTSISVDHEFYGFDIDDAAVTFNQLVLGIKATNRNTLATAGRVALGLPTERSLIVVGNPPYNDQTSKNRRQLKKAITASHPDILDRDTGIAFLKASFLLKPKAVCFLHPYSYILKFTNYVRAANLGFWPSKVAIFSSKVFATHGSNAFPCVAALWVPRAQPKKISRNELRKEHLQILQQVEDVYDLTTRQPNKLGSFQASRYNTIDNPNNKILKYANDSPSDIGIYQYTFRDLNSLLASGNLTKKMGNTVPLLLSQPNTIFQYAALNVMRRYWKQRQQPLDFILGNLSPIYPEPLLTTPTKYLVLLDTMATQPALFREVFSDMIKLCTSGFSNPLILAATQELETGCTREAINEIRKRLIAEVQAL